MNKNIFSAWKKKMLLAVAVHGVTEKKRELVLSFEHALIQGVMKIMHLQLLSSRKININVID